MSLFLIIIGVLLTFMALFGLYTLSRILGFLLVENDRHSTNTAITAKELAATVQAQKLLVGAVSELAQAQTHLTGAVSEILEAITPPPKTPRGSA